MVDHADAANSLANHLEMSGLSTRVLIDVDCGMHRTGIPLGDDLQGLRQAIDHFQSLEYVGLHVYDGHLHQPSAETRQSAAEKIINAVRQYDQQHPSSTIIGGGSPTFNYWAKSTPWECSPGTTLFWDLGYGSAFPELPFEIAVALLTRVVSKPGQDRFCIDLGYKSLASEMPLSERLCLIGMPEAKIISHSEEHMVISSTATSDLHIGQPLLAFPRHVLPHDGLARECSSDSQRPDNLAEMVGNGPRPSEGLRIPDDAVCNPLRQDSHGPTSAAFCTTDSNGLGLSGLAKAEKSWPPVTTTRTLLYIVPFLLQFNPPQHGEAQWLRNLTLRSTRFSRARCASSSGFW